MVEFAVGISELTGFKLDLQDVRTNFSANAARFLPTLSLPAGTGGQLAVLAQSVQKLESTLAGAHRNNLGVLDTLAANLGTAANQFQNSDEQHALAISRATATLDGQATAATSSAQGISRFGGLQLPTLQDVQDAQYTVRQVVTATIETLTPYDEPLSRAIGIKPVADYLSPLVADWESLQGVGKRIALLGINDYVTSQNISGGASWLRTSWTGDASNAFGITATSLGNSIAGRSTDLDTLAKIVENGGRLLERLVCNQSIGLLGAVTKSIGFLDFTLPLGVWALLLDSPMRDSMKSQISSAVETLKKDAAARKDAITTTIERIAGAMNYEPGRTALSYNPNEFELPDKVIIDHSTGRYGYGNNVWWEDAAASAV
ncbi:hypothetical protein D5S18_01850 [Nocardia panacis]|uniref:Uncharacterized protein n=1 Tax=Nocardia panacis TaxID=2340916 RepID=A0A3A4L0V3_9NOCA|nr:hypothetical protein [Nocardia panacis]RJO80015.1 hypothetical protein D5S18_01850 [Nocardia panacis]